MNSLFKTGDPLWIPAACTLYFPDMSYPRKYKVCDRPICAWFVEPIDTKWVKVMYENTFWSIENTNIFPYPQERK